MGNPGYIFLGEVHLMLKKVKTAFSVLIILVVLAGIGLSMGSRSVSAADDGRV